MRQSVLLGLVFAMSIVTASCGDDEEVTPSPTLRPAVGASATPGVSTERGTPVPATGSTARVDFQARPNPPTGAALLVDVRVGGHPEDGGYDRIVFEFAAGRPAGRVEYVASAAQCASGLPVDPQGSATLFVHFQNTNAHNDQGQLTIPGTTITGPGTSILQSISICDFEAVVQWAVGTSGMKPFVVSLLDNPSRVVVDVKH